MSLELLLLTSAAQTFSLQNRHMPLPSEIQRGLYIKAVTWCFTCLFKGNLQMLCYMCLTHCIDVGREIFLKSCWSVLKKAGKC